MKHISKYTLGLAAILSLGSCLKDKGFDNGTYGINGADKNAIITMSAAQNSLTSVSVDYVNTSQTVELTGIIYDADQPASKDINVTIDTLSARPGGLITAWNADPNNPYLTPIPASFYQLVSGLTVKIVAGQKIGSLKITIPDATRLDVNLTYGLGVTLVSNDASVTTSSNLKKAVFAISAKNKYDGVYTLKFKMLDWDAGYGISNQALPWGGPVFMITAGATSVRLFDDWGFGTYIHPARGSSGTYTGFGSTDLKLTFDPATDALSDAQNVFVNPSNGRTFRVNTAVTSSRWNASTGDIFAAIIMNHPGRNPADLFIYDTLTYVGPR